MASNGVMTNARHVIRRRRPASSCEPCRRRRVRCDHQLPCGACVRARNALLCEYKDRVPAATSAPTRSTSLVADTQVQRPLVGDDSPDTGVGGASPGTPNTQPTEGSRGNASASGTSEAQASVSLRSTSPQRDRGGRSTLLSDSSLRRTLLSNSSLPESVSSLVIPTPVPRLRHAADKTKLFGQTHWVHLADKVEFPFPAQCSELTFCSSQSIVVLMLLMMHLARPRQKWSRLVGKCHLFVNSSSITSPLATLALFSTCRVPSPRRQPVTS